MGSEENATTCEIRNFSFHIINKAFWTLLVPSYLFFPSSGRETHFCLLRMPSASLKKGRTEWGGDGEGKDGGLKVFKVCKGKKVKTEKTKCNCQFLPQTSLLVTR